MFNAYQIKSNQFSTHPATKSVAEKHTLVNYQRPFAKSQIAAFESACNWISKTKGELILDSGCGTGDSTLWLANSFPNAKIIGIDQSSSRLSVAKNKLRDSKYENVFFVRARLEDLWRLALRARWPVSRHYVFYPNPWPKSEHLGRRWHGHPVFPWLLVLSCYLEVRSNWLIYVNEFALATQAVTGVTSRPEIISSPAGVSAFERKYRENNSPCYALRYDQVLVPSLPIKRKAS